MRAKLNRNHKWSQIGKFNFQETHTSGTQDLLNLPVGADSAVKSFALPLADWLGVLSYCHQLLPPHYSLFRIVIENFPCRKNAPMNTSCKLGRARLAPSLSPSDDGGCLGRQTWSRGHGERSQSEGAKNNEYRSRRFKNSNEPSGLALQSSFESVNRQSRRQKLL